jgi:hypothetical protein
MSNPLTRRQLAALIGKNSAYITVYVHRGKLIEEIIKGKNMIDTDHPVNKQFLADKINKSNEAEIAKVIEQAEQRAEREREFNIEIPLDDIKINSANIDQLKKKEEIRKIRADILLKDLEYKKKKAKVLPLDFVLEWSGRNIRGAFGESINFGYAMIEDLCNELGASTETKLKYKKKFKQGYTELVKAGIRNQEPEAINFAKEYAYLNKW